MQLNPAKSIIDTIGVEKVAQITGKHISRVYRWMKPVGAHGGTGGIIPQRDAIKLLEHSKREGLRLTEADFLRSPSIAPEPRQEH